MIGGLPTIQGAGGRNLIRAAPAFIPPIARNTLPPNYHIVKYAKHNENAMWCKHIFSPHPQKNTKMRSFIYFNKKKVKNSYMYLHCNIDLLCVMRIFPGTQS